MIATKKDFVLGLAEAGAIKFGRFKLKSGQTSPFYIDLRDIVAYPKLMSMLTDLIVQNIQFKEFDLISGIPYTALPIATLVSDRLEKPMIYMRKEKKAYGTGKSIEGRFKRGDKCLVIDDVMSTGASKLETAESFKTEGLEISEFVIVIDRSNDGIKKVQDRGYKISALVTLKEMLSIMEEASLISAKQKREAISFVSNGNNDFAAPDLIETRKSTDNNNTIELIDTIRRKETNLVLSLDVTDSTSFFDLLEKVGPHIAMVKTHVDILEDYSFVFVERLKEMADKLDFMVFEDRKFADIGNTVRKQYRDGVYKISDWSDFITVHGLPGPGILDGLFDELEEPGSSFLLAKMSAAGNLFSDNYSRQVMEMGQNYPQWVSGFIGFAESREEIMILRNKIPSGMLLLMPGVNLLKNEDNLGQRYVTVEEAVSGGADLIIVGRGIYEAEDPVLTAMRYKDIAWNSLSNRKTGTKK